jgi:acetate kinase
MAAALGGLDVLAFTGGIGEHSSLVRGRAAVGLGFLGVAVDDALNSAADGDADISPVDAPVRSVVVTAREDLEIARLTRAALT